MIYFNNSEVIDWRYNTKQMNLVYHDDAVIFGKEPIGGIGVEDFNFNFNFKNYDAATHSVPNDPTANWQQDLVLNGTPVVNTDHITITNSDAYAQFPFDTASNNIFNQNSTNGYEMTIIFKVSNCSGVDLISNRGYAQDNSVPNTSSYNWMVRPKSGNKMCLHDSSGEKGNLIVTTNPNIVVMKVDSNRTLTIKSLTDNISTTASSLSFSYQSGRICFFCTNAYDKTTTTIRERFSGTCYWMFHAKRILTDDEITQVINYNENL